MSFPDIQGNASETPESSPETVAVPLSHPGVCAGQEGGHLKSLPSSPLPLFCACSSKENVQGAPQTVGL